MSDQPKDSAKTRRMTLEEAEAVLILVRGGWLKLEPTFGG